MTRAILVVLLGVLAPVSAALAEPVPDSVLDKDFTSCMGGESPEQDPQRRDYCFCVRDGMKDWTLEDYVQVATEELGSKAHNDAQPPARIQELAQTCINKTLH